MVPEWRETGDEEWNKTKIIVFLLLDLSLTAPSSQNIYVCFGSLFSESCCDENHVECHVQAKRESALIY